METIQEHEESFFDPNQVPEELKPAYKQMQAAFTKKTQEAAEIRKQSESFKQQAEAYKKYEQYIPVIEEMLQGRQDAQPSIETAQIEAQLKKAGYSEEAIEMAKILSGGLLNVFEQKQQSREQVAHLESQISEAAKVDSRLNDQSLTYQTEDGKFTFGELVEQVVAADPNWRQDPVAATRKAVRRIDALIGTAKTQGKEELSASAKSKANLFPKQTSSPQGAVKTGQPMTVMEAYEQAKAEIGG